MLTSSAAAMLRSKESLGFLMPRVTSEMQALLTPHRSASSPHVKFFSFSATSAMTSMLRLSFTQSQLLTEGKQVVYRRDGD